MKRDNKTPILGSTRRIFSTLIWINLLIFNFIVKSKIKLSLL